MPDQITLTTRFSHWDEDDSLWHVEVGGNTFTVNAHNGYGATLAVAAELGLVLDGSGTPNEDRSVYTYTATKQEVPL